MTIYTNNRIHWYLHYSGNLEITHTHPENVNSLSVTHNQSWNFQLSKYIWRSFLLCFSLFHFVELGLIT